MDAAGYSTLSRQSGLMHEMKVIANNIANMSTAGFRREGLVFEEFIAPVSDGSSLSMAYGNARVVDLSQGGMTHTGATLDLALKGHGFFQVQTPDGPRLTRAGAFTVSATGQLVNYDGHPVLDDGGSPIILPQDEGDPKIAQDGTISTENGPIARIGVWEPSDPLSLRHDAGTLFSSNGVQPGEKYQVVQGFIEESNVIPVQEVSRMVEVQRAYEMAQSFAEQEDKRMRGVIETLGR